MKSHFVTALALIFGVLVLTCLPTHLVAEDEAGVKCLFDGESLEGWEGKSQFWSVRDGVITGQTTADNPTKGNTFLIWRGGEVSDFELTLQFRMVGGNSGIQYRSVELNDYVVAGYQADFEAGDRFIGILYEEKGRGILALRGQELVIGEDGNKEVVGATCDEEKFLASIKKEDWNEYTITAKGNHLVQKINGFTTIDVTDNQSVWRKSKATPPKAGTDDKKLLDELSKPRQKGILALQLHQGPPMLVQFKDIKLKELK